MTTDYPTVPTTRVVDPTLTYLHAGPTFHTELLTQITHGFELHILKTYGDWCHVRQRDGTIRLRSSG